MIGDLNLKTEFSVTREDGLVSLINVSERDAALIALLGTKHELSKDILEDREVFLTDVIDSLIAEVLLLKRRNNRW